MNDWQNMEYSHRRALYRWYEEITWDVFLPYLHVTILSLFSYACMCRSSGTCIIVLHVINSAESKQWIASLGIAFLSGKECSLHLYEVSRKFSPLRVEYHICIMKQYSGGGVARFFLIDQCLPCLLHQSQRNSQISSLQNEEISTARREKADQIRNR